MKKLIKNICFAFAIMLFAVSSVACGAKVKTVKAVAEKVEGGSVVFSEVEFKNADTVKIKQDNKLVVVSGSIEKMTDAQKVVFNKENVTHVVVLKFMFDDERTIESFEIKGDMTKVYSVDESVDNYVGSISSLLDSEAGEDAYTYLILSANTKEYKLKTTYSDETESVLTVKIDATLVSADEQ